MRSSLSTYLFNPTNPLPLVHQGRENFLKKYWKLIKTKASIYLNCPSYEQINLNTKDNTLYYVQKKATRKLFQEIPQIEQVEVEALNTLKKNSKALKEPVIKKTYLYIQQTLLKFFSIHYTIISVLTCTT